MAALVNNLRSNKTYGKLIQPFENIRLPNGNQLYVPGVPNLKFSANAQVYANGTYSLGNNQASQGYSSTIRFNTNAIANASKLFLQVAIIHETAHAYAHFYVKAGSYGVPVDTVKYSTWALNIVNFDRAASQLTYNNYMDHSNFLESYVDNFVNILKELNGAKYTEKEYQMAAVYGLNNPGNNPDNSTEGVAKFTQLSTTLNTSFNRTLAKWGITSSELNTFYNQNLVNVPWPNKLPANCP